MEKKTIRSGAPYVAAGAAVLFVALTVGIGSAVSYVFAAAAFALGYVGGKKVFPDRVIQVQRAPQSGNAEVDALIAEARGQLDAIARTNDVIAEEALSAQIADIESTCRTILDRLEEQPNMLSSLRTFLRYYLPATLKLLEARAKLEGEENAQIAGKIRDAMAQVQKAFHKQLDALNEFRFISLESEMDVLADMLRSDGLLGRENDGAAAAEPTDGEADPFAGLFSQEGR